jgi:hypothetical protein
MLLTNYPQALLVAAFLQVFGTAFVCGEFSRIKFVKSYYNSSLCNEHPETESDLY